MGPESKEILSEAGCISDMNYQYLCLGVFFDQYAKRHDFTKELPEKITIATGGPSGYIIQKDHLLTLLHCGYGNVNDISFFHYLVTIHSLKGVVTAVSEAFGDDKSPNIEIKPVQYLFMLMNMVTCKHEKPKITHFYCISEGSAFESSMCLKKITQKLGISGAKLTHKFCICRSLKNRGF